MQPRSTPTLAPACAGCARPVPLAAAALVGTALLLAGAAPADTERHSFSMPTGIDHDDNPNLLSSGERGVTRYRVSPQYQLVRQGDTDTLTLTAGATLERSSDTTLSADRDDPRLSLDWQTETPTRHYGLQVSHEQSSSRSSDLAETGLITADTTRTTQTLGGNWGLSLSDSARLVFNGSWQTVRHDSAASTDYDTTRLSARYQLQLSERDDASLSLNASQYKPQSGGGADSRNLSLVAGYQSRLSENLNWTASFGAVRITGAQRDTDWEGSLGANYSGELHSASASLGRSVSASGAAGGFAPSDRLQLQWGYELSEKSRLNLSGQWSRFRGTSPSDTTTLALGYSRELSPFWRLGFSLERQRVDRTTSASATQVGFTLTYSHPDF